MNLPLVLSVLLSACLSLPAGAAPASPAPTPASAPARETVVWYVNNFPPYSITLGPDTGTGINDRAMALLIKNMPQFQHKVVDAALPRTIEAMKTRPDACSVSLLRTAERETVMHFSKPRSLVLPNAVVTLRQRAGLLKPYMNPQGELMLDAMLSAGKLTLGLSSDRSYGPSIDGLIKAHPSAIVNIPAKDQFESRLLKLVNQHEFDAILGYAIELKYTARALKLDIGQLVAYPIAESSELLAPGVACSKSDQGLRIITAIERVLADENLRREMDADYRSRLDDESAAHYDRLLQKRRAAEGAPR